MSLTKQETRQRAALIDNIQDAKNALEAAQHQYLKFTGWEYTSATPGCLWLWQKATPPPRDPRDTKRHVAGRIMMLDTETALAMQLHWDDIEMDFGDEEEP